MELNYLWIEMLAFRWAMFSIGVGIIVLLTPAVVGRSSDQDAESRLFICALGPVIPMLCVVLIIAGSVGRGVSSILGWEQDECLIDIDRSSVFITLIAVSTLLDITWFHHFHYLPSVTP